MKLKKANRKYLEAHHYGEYIIILEHTGPDVNGNGKGILTAMKCNGDKGEYFALASYWVYTNALIPFDKKDKEQFFNGLITIAEKNYFGE